MTAIFGSFFLHASTHSANITLRDADMAQLVEHHLAKVGVAGSNPVVRSRKLKAGHNMAGLFRKRRRGQVVRQRPAKPSPPVRIRASPPSF